MPAQAVAMADDRVCIGVIVGAHGIRGDVRVKSFTANPADLTAYGPLTDAGGSREYRLTVLGSVRGALRARVDGVTSRNDAEALAGIELYIERAALPDTGDDEYYHSDLVGLRAVTADGTTFGTVTALYDFGAGDMVEIALAGGGSVVLPFSAAAVPVVDIVAGQIVVEPPAEIEASANTGRQRPGCGR